MSVTHLCTHGILCTQAHSCCSSFTPTAVGREEALAARRADLATSIDEAALAFPEPFGMGRVQQGFHKSDMAKAQLRPATSLPFWVEGESNVMLRPGHQLYLNLFLQPTAESLARGEGDEDGGMIYRRRMIAQVRMPACNAADGETPLVMMAASCTVVVG
jgi:hypothetical protein